MKEKSYSKSKVVEAHRKCCPYWHISLKWGKDTLSGQPVKCGANYTECNNKCHYMKTFIAELKNAK